MNAPRTLVVGDVHGCRQELEDLLALFAFVEGKDRLALVGDLVNKGPDSAGVLDLVDRLGGLAVKGNHEAKLLSIADKDLAAWTPKDVKFAVKILFGHGAEPRIDLDELSVRLSRMAARVRTLPLWRDLGSCLVVHAGLQPGKQRLEDMEPRVLTTVRTWDGKGEVLESELDPPWYECMTWPKTVVFGHWALKGIVDLPRIKGLDSGCVYGGALTGYCPEEDRLLSVKAHQLYAPMKRD